MLIFANLWTRLRSPRPNRASGGGYLLTGTSAAREDELLGVTGGRRKRLDIVPDDWRQTDDARAAAAAANGAAAATPASVASAVGVPSSECLINVTDFSDCQEATGTERQIEQPVAVLQVPSITTTNINNNNLSSNNNINNNNNNTNNMSRIVQPRYRFRDLLLGDFSFNDDGER
ncbi:hypothetical protein AWZ03_005712 [Drosophila navojoa]|uniref:Uncharacterized protein n=1 Tax=Drosophila navojoa TaxID=7232 RepID=A0A484BJK4_DRONA|nr:hypothetical protein AWZ03_005712 [Drosophila navojoa]